MNRATQAKIERILTQMERRASRPLWRFPTAALVLAAGLLLGQQLLVRFVPMVWEALLPGGLDAASTLSGWPGLIWRAAVFSHVHQTGIFAAIAGIGIVSVMLGGRSFLFRVLLRLAALGVIVLDAGIVMVALKVSYRATADASGLPGL
jgi:hypothetical protein